MNMNNKINMLYTGKSAWQLWIIGLWPRFKRNNFLEDFHVCSINKTCGRFSSTMMHISLHLMLIIYKYMIDSSLFLRNVTDQSVNICHVLLLSLLQVSPSEMKKHNKLNRMSWLKKNAIIVWAYCYPQQIWTDFLWKRGIKVVTQERS